MYELAPDIELLMTEAIGLEHYPTTESAASVAYIRELAVSA